MSKAKLCLGRLLLGKLVSSLSVTSPEAPEEECSSLQVQPQAMLSYSRLLCELAAVTWQVAFVSSK